MLTACVCLFALQIGQAIICKDLLSPSTRTSKEQMTIQTVRDVWVFSLFGYIALKHRSFERPLLLQTVFSSMTMTCRIDPPATPPRSSSTSEPGLLTSKERMTIIWGGDMKSLTGTGMRFTIYSHTASTLYFNWAEIGTTGAFSAIVPLIKS